MMDSVLAAVIAEEKRNQRCLHPAMACPPPGAVGLDKKADCPVCGRRVKVTARGLYARHNKTAPDGRERLTQLPVETEETKSTYAVDVVLLCHTDDELTATAALRFGQNLGSVERRIISKALRVLSDELKRDA